MSRELRPASPGQDLAPQPQPRSLGSLPGASVCSQGSESCRGWLDLGGSGLSHIKFLLVCFQRHGSLQNDPP